MKFPWSPVFGFPAKSRQRGFSLIEIIVVMAIIGFLLVLSTPSLQSSFKGSKLTQAGDQLRNHLTLAQQTALKENLPVEVHFYKLENTTIPDGKEYVTAYQIFVVRPNSRNPDVKTAELERERILNLNRLPQGVVISQNEKLSSLLEQKLWHEDIKDEVKGLDGTRATKEMPFFMFQFRPDGSLSLPDNKRWFLTLLTNETLRSGKETTPDNYVCLQIDPVTGQVKNYTPGI